jgi:hypothetical protein
MKTKGPMTVREKLIAKGCKESQVIEEIFKNIYPHRLRVWWGICRFCSRAKTTPEIAFAQGLAEATSLQDLSDLHWDYRHALPSEKTFLMKPSRKRVRSYFKQMQHHG